LTRRIHEHDGKFYAWNQEDLEWQEITASLDTEEVDVVRRCKVASNPNTPVEVLAKLSTDENEDVRESVAWNPNTPAEVLIKLSTDENEDVRKPVAWNPNTPVEVLAKLSTDENEDVRESVASNPNTPVEVLAKLSTDENEDVRRPVARNINTPVEVLAKLSNDADTKVISALVGNPRTPDHLLDEPEFNLLQTLIDAESRGSGLATRLREIYVNFDSVQASKNHEKIKSSLVDMQNELNDILSNCDEDEQETAFEDFFIDCAEFFDGGWGYPINTSAESYQVIFDELSKSMETSGPFGNSELLQTGEQFEEVGWTNNMQMWGFLLSPFIPRNVLRSWVGWHSQDNNYMSSIAVSPILSKRLLSYIVEDIIKIHGSQWIGFALLVNANSDLHVLDSICKYGRDGQDIAYSYCEFPTGGGSSEEDVGVCGPITGRWDSPEFFNELGWTRDDLTGSVIEGDKPLCNLVRVTSLYLETTQGSKEKSRSALSSSATFGKLLVAFRMIQEFKYGRASLEDQIESESTLVRSVLYWKPGLNEGSREKLRAEGLAFEEEIGQLLMKGWEEDVSLIY